MQISPINNFIKPLNYALLNKSDVSNVFKENAGKNLIENVSPVKYPDAKVVDKLSKKIEEDKVYNDIANKLTPSYNSSLNAQNFSQIGSNFDTFI